MRSGMGSVHCTGLKQDGNNMSMYRAERTVVAATWSYRVQRAVNKMLGVTTAQAGHGAVGGEVKHRAT